MTTTLATLTTSCRVDLRDVAATTFSATELGDMIGAGITSIQAIYPKEYIGSVTISASTYSYTMPTGMDSVFRVDRYDASGNFLETIPEGAGGPNTGWQVHASKLLVPRWTWTTGETLQVWGYGTWTYIDSSSSSSATTDLDQLALAALRVFVRVNAYKHLIADRAKFQQYQQTPGNADATLLGMIQLGQQARQEWRDQETLLRRPRKTG